MFILSEILLDLPYDLCRLSVVCSVLSLVLVHVTPAMETARSSIFPASEHVGAHSGTRSQCGSPDTSESAKNKQQLLSRAVEHKLAHGDG